jgi:hypothetical protein
VLPRRTLLPATDSSRGCGLKVNSSCSYCNCHCSQMFKPQAYIHNQNGQGKLKQKISTISNPGRPSYPLHAISDPALSKSATFLSLVAEETGEMIHIRFLTLDRQDRSTPQFPELNCLLLSTPSLHSARVETTSNGKRSCSKATGKPRCGI